MKTIVERLGQYAADLAFDELGEPVLDYAKRILLDGLACVFGRLDSEPARIVRSTAEED
jgi:2-methylcitrate dehydratase PrpD